MRDPFGIDAFDHVFNLFTSFGYFEDPVEHLTVVSNMARSLKAGGTLVLDYLNTCYAESHLTPSETLARDGVEFTISRWSDDAHIYKRIVVENGGAAGRREYTERVAKLAIADFRFMFALCGLRMEAVYGDYQLAPFDAGRSPRMLLLARKLSSEAPSYLRDRFLRMRLTVSGVMPR
jgi:hypothetical protein